MCSPWLESGAPAPLSRHVRGGTIGRRGVDRDGERSSGPSEHSGDEKHYNPWVKTRQDALDRAVLSAIP